MFWWGRLGQSPRLNPWAMFTWFCLFTRTVITYFLNAQSILQSSFLSILFLLVFLRHACMQFEVTTATDVEEAKKILGAGFEYVTQKDSIMLFRKPKRFKG
jgi:hypothetical protein